LKNLVYRSAARESKAGWITDIEFVFAECGRIQMAISDAVKKSPRSEGPAEGGVWGDLPGLNGM
jgi:hypothetical protein